MKEILLEKERIEFKLKVRNKIHSIWLVKDKDGIKLHFNDLLPLIQPQSSNCIKIKFEG